MSFYRLNLANKAGQQIPNEEFLIAQYCHAESKEGQNLQYYRHINVHNWCFQYCRLAYLELLQK